MIPNKTPSGLSNLLSKTNPLDELNYPPLHDQDENGGASSIISAENLLDQKLDPMENQGQNPEQPQPLSFLQTSKKDHISFAKISRLSRPQAKVQCVCEIPKKSLLLVALQDSNIVNIYHIVKFNLVAVRKTKKVIRCISYCKELERIIVGGMDELLQLWSPETLQIQAQCPHSRHLMLQNVLYVSESNTFIATTTVQIRVYNIKLQHMKNVTVPSHPYHWFSDPSEIFSLPDNYLLTTCYCNGKKVLLLSNLQTGTTVSLAKEIYIRERSCVVMTEKSPQIVFSCLGVFNSQSCDDKFFSALIQFTIDTKTEKVIPLRSSNISTQTFSNLRYIENSQYFLTKKLEDYAWKILLLSINKDQVETLQVISRPSPIEPSSVSTYLMLKDGSLLVEINKEDVISLSKSIVHRERPSKISRRSFVIISTLMIIFFAYILCVVFFQS